MKSESSGAHPPGLARFFSTSRWSSRWITARWPQAMGLLDQSIVSASNFIAVWVMARKLAVADYGLYVLVMGMILALNSIQSALVLFPFTIRYAAAELQDWRSGTLRCLLITLASTAIQIPIVIAGCLYLGHLLVAVAAVLTICSWQAQEFLRRAMFQRQLFSRAIISDGIRYAIPALLVVCLPRQALSTQVVLTFTAVSSALALLTCIGILWRGELSDVSWKRTRREFRESWATGRSIILYNIFGTALGQGSVWILGSMDGLAAASQFQALNNLMGITNPPVQGIGSVQDPAVARSYLLFGPRTAIRHAFPYLAVVGVIVFPVLGVFVIFPGVSLSRFYGQTSPYLNLALPLQIAAVGQLLGIGAQFASSMLACLRRAEIIWRLQMMTSIACLAVIIPAVRWGRLVGYLTALTVFYGLRLIAMIWSLCRIYRENSIYEPSQAATVSA